MGAYCLEIGCRSVRLRIIFDRVGREQECGLELEVRVDIDDTATIAEIEEAAFAETRALLAIASASLLIPEAGQRRQAQREQ